MKRFFVSLFSRSESEIEIPGDRDREVKFKKNLENSRETRLSLVTEVDNIVWNDVGSVNP